jgi:hypothetical protein
MRIPRTTLSDWFHRGHTTAGHTSGFHAPVRLGVATQPARKVPGFIQWFAGLRQSTGRRPLRQAHQKSGSFPPPALPDINGRMTLSDSRQHRHPAATSRPLPSCQAGIPQLPDPPFQHAVPITPMDQAGARVGCFPTPLGPSPFLRRVGIHDFTFEACSGFTTLRPAGLLNRPRRPSSRGFDPPSYPNEPLVSYQVLQTTSWVDASSTGEPRRWGALRNSG